MLQAVLTDQELIIANLERRIRELSEALPAEREMAKASHMLWLYR